MMANDFAKVKQQIQREHDQKIRRELRAQRKVLAAHIRELKARRRAAVKRVREWCKRSSARVTVRAKEIREQHRQEANREIAELRRASKSACARRVKRAKKKGLTAQQIAKQEKRQALADERMLTRASMRARTRAAARSSKRERQAEDDDQVRNNMTAELAPVWDQLANQFKPKPRQSRTEQFLAWVEENPDEVIRMQSDLGDRYADDFIREAEEENRRLEKLLKSSRRLSPRDLDKLGISSSDMHAAGFSPEDPHDVLAFLQGTTDYYKSDEAVPF